MGIWSQWWRSAQRKLRWEPAETLISEDLWGVYGLALDVSANKMYFSDYWTSGPTNYDGTIRSANMDGTMVRTIVNFGPSDLALISRLVHQSFPSHLRSR